MYKNNIVSGTLFTLLFVLLVVLTRQTLPKRIVAYPQLVGYAGIAISAMLVFVNVFRLAKAKGTDVETKKLNKAEIVRVVTLATLLILYIFLLRVIGYLVTTVVFMFVVMTLMSKTQRTVRAIVKYAIIAIAFSGTVYFVFTVFLNVSMPTGFLI